MIDCLADADIRILGAISHDEAMHLQEQEYKRVRSGISHGSVFFLEHNPPVITLGRRAGAQSLLVREDDILRRGYQLRTTNRGGLATVHEPGQAVVYFVLPVAPKSGSIFVSQILQLAAEFLENTYGILVRNDVSRPGLWWNEKKLCFCGFDFSGGISRHGIAINVSNSLEGFSMIVPCGMPDARATSVSEILERHVDCGSFIAEFSAFLRAQMKL